MRAMSKVRNKDEENQFDIRLLKVSHPTRKGLVIPMQREMTAKGRVTIRSLP